MDINDKKALLKNRLMLARSLDLGELLQYLVQEGIFNDRMVEKIESKSTTFGRNVAFLNSLPTRGPNAYDKFIEGLHETHQEFIIEQLLKSKPTENVENRPPPAQTNTEWLTKEHSLRSASGNPGPVSVDFHDGSRKLMVEKTTFEFYKSSFHRGYKMTSRPRGYAMIVNVTEFDSAVDLSHRQGGNLDKENLGQVLQHLGFETLIVENQTAEEIRTTLKSFAQRNEHKTRDACVVALLTHGSEGSIYGRDGETVLIQDIFSYFDNAHCPNLRNKPKIFFIQACRGDSYDGGIDVADGRTKMRRSSCVASGSDVNFDEPRLPTRSDMIFGYATQLGQAAMRNTHHGSWYIEALVKVLAKSAKNRDLAEILTSVNSVIKGMQCHSPGSDLHSCKEMPIFHSTLCKKLYLYPGIFESQK